MPSQHIQGQLQTQNSVDTGNQFMDRHNLKTKKKIKASTGERKHIATETGNKQIQR
jgi:hypothetical protein